MKNQFLGVPLCQRCLHPQSWHRHDDEACLSKHPQPCAPAGCSSIQHPTHDAPFRCLGYDCMADDATGGDCECPDYVENCDGLWRGSDDHDRT